jgi:hypothetical protein
MVLFRDLGYFNIVNAQNTEVQNIFFLAENLFAFWKESLVDP